VGNFFTQKQLKTGGGYFQFYTRAKAALDLKQMWLLGPLVELLAFGGKRHSQKLNQTGLGPILKDQDQIFSLFMDPKSVVILLFCLIFFLSFFVS
jgi:hypothetical protein